MRRRSQTPAKQVTQTLLEAVPAPVLALDYDGRILLVNAAAETMFGYQREQMIGQPIHIVKPNHEPKAQAVPALTARLLRQQEARNRELSRELHDGFSQKLAAMGMEVLTLLEGPHKIASALPERVRDLSTRINGLARDVHALSRRLHPAVLTELGLEAAIREECVGFSAKEGLPVRFSCRRIPTALPEDISLCLYRVAQESLTNVARHANAASVSVVLLGSKEGITLRVVDRGAGFQLEAVKRKSGLGLVSMEERARLVHGTYHVHSSPGQGTTVTLFIPLPYLSE